MPAQTDQDPAIQELEQIHRRITMPEHKFTYKITLNDEEVTETFDNKADAMTRWAALNASVRNRILQESTIYYKDGNGDWQMGSQD